MFGYPFNNEHFFEGGGSQPFNVLAPAALAQICAVHPTLITLAILLQTVRLLAIAPLEMPLLLIAHSENAKGRRLGGYIQKNLVLLL